MAATSISRLLYLDEFLDLGLFDFIEGWPFKGLYPSRSSNASDIYNSLKPLSIDQPWNVYLRDVDMPSRWHFSSSYRIAPLYIVPDPGWVLFNSKEEFDPTKNGTHYARGIHGYDNDDASMRSVFLARGPQFIYNYTIASFENVEVYGIMANILGLKPNPNNGTLPRGKLPKESSAVTTVPSSSNENQSGGSVNEEGSAETEMSEEDWEQIAADLEAAEEDSGLLTWKEYLELKTAELKSEAKAWWDWIKHGGHYRSV